VIKLPLPPTFAIPYGPFIALIAANQCAMDCAGNVQARSHPEARRSSSYDEVIDRIKVAELI
jgi:hypothetical protein